MTYTDRGLREIAAGLREAKALVNRKRSDMQHQMGLLEAEMSALGKIEAAIDTAIEVMQTGQQTQKPT